MDEKKIVEEFDAWAKDNVLPAWLGNVFPVWKACAAHYEEQLSAKDAEIAELRQKLDAYRIIQTLPEEERIEKIIAERVRQQLEVANAKLAEREKQEPIGVSTEVEAALLYVLWHHQGGSSKIGQPVRKWLGIGPHDHLTPEQLAKAKLIACPVPALTPGEVVEWRKDSERFRWLLENCTDFMRPVNGVLTSGNFKYKRGSCLSPREAIDKAMLAAKSTKEKGG